jgi:hypothetical protein
LLRRTSQHSLCKSAANPVDFADAKQNFSGSTRQNSRFSPCLTIKETFVEILNAALARTEIGKFQDF